MSLSRFLKEYISKFIVKTVTRIIYDMQEAGEGDIAHARASFTFVRSKCGDMLMDPTELNK